jgi:phage tail-like protein
MSFSLPLNHRFGVYFFAGGIIPNPLDIHFQKVSGLSMSMDMDSVNEGGQNLYTHRIPKKVSYGNLILERGVPAVSPLGIEFNIAFSMFKFAPSNVLITLFNEDSIPVMGWMFLKAYPVKWSMSDLDANGNSLVIDTMELAYSRFQVIKI